MANKDQRFGFQPVSYLSGADWNGKARQYYIAQADTNSYYSGDVVVTSPGASDGRVQDRISIGVPLVTKAVAGDTVRGVVISFTADTVDLSQVRLPTVKLKSYFVQVVDDPSVIFAIQGDNTTTLSNSCVGNYADFTPAVPTNPALGLSGTVLNTASIANNPLLPLRIMGLYRGDFTAYSTFLVMFNIHELG